MSPGGNRAVYVISVAAELAGVHPQTLRIYERRGLVDPARTVGGSRRYSDRDIATGGTTDERVGPTTDERDAPSPPNYTPPTKPGPEDKRGPMGAEDPEGGGPTGSPPGDITSSPGGQTGPDGPDGATDELTRARAERDEYLDALRRLQADFENYRKRMSKGQGEQVERAAGDLVGKLLPVLDTLDMALAHITGADPAPFAEAGSLAQVGCALTDVLAREGLEKIDPKGQSFDPTEHDAVVLDPEGDGADSEVTAVLRAGYRWKGRVLRPAMVKVRG